MSAISSIRLVISQPTTSKHPSEWDFFNDECVGRTISTLMENSHKALNLIGKPREEIIPHLVDGEKQCAYCKAKVDCPKIVKSIDEATAGEFEVLKEFTPFTPESLAKLYLQTKNIRSWCDAVDARVVQMYKEGEITEEHGLKAVAGKMGNRAWNDAKAVEEEMKSMRLKHDQMYSYKLISPTQAEKTLADNPRKWKKLSEHIVQAAGEPVIVSIDDKRPAINIRPTAEGFENVDDDLV